MDRLKGLALSSGREIERVPTTRVSSRAFPTPAPAQAVSGI